MKILLVENHREFTSVVIPAFLSEHDVTVVTSCAAAREVLSGGSFDAVLVDYDLDDAKGDTLVRWIASQAAPPVVAISAHDPGNEALTRAGAAVACSKAHFDQIGGVLDRLLRR
jgi:DNA-binding response OmpR family regulator